jgi:O-antigen/teichoic acid export membrane protein
LIGAVNILKGRVKKFPGFIFEATFEDRNLVLFSALSAILFTISSRVFETWTLNKWHGPAAVALFAISAFLFKGLCDVVLSGVGSVFLPRITKVIALGDFDSNRDSIEMLVKVYLCLGCLISGIGFLSSPTAITLLYGSKFVEAIYPTSILLAGLGLLSVSGAFSVLQVAANSYRDRLYCALISASASFVFSSALIPRFGLWGACVSMIVSSAVGTACALVLLRKRAVFVIKNDTIQWIKKILLLWFALMLMHSVPLALLDEYFSAFVTVPSFALCFLLLIFRIGCFTEQQHSELLSSFRVTKVNQ